jgi:hypothetical protein
MKKSNLITILIILGIISLTIFIKIKPQEITSEEIAKCIGENSKLYNQIGCPHCENQKNIFGENIKYLNIILCDNDWEQCSQITGTPSWEINGEMYTGTKSIEELKKLTNC